MGKFDECELEWEVFWGEGIMLEECNGKPFPCQQNRYVCIGIGVSA